MEEKFRSEGRGRAAWDLLLLLVQRDLKLKYRRSFLGYLWSVLNPLLIMLVMSFVFSSMFQNEIENFPVYLFSGQLLFNFFSGSTGQAVTAITENGALLKKASVPQIIFPLARVTGSLVDFLFSLGALAIVMLATGARLSLWVLLAPAAIAETALFSLGMGLFLSQANVFFRDIRYIYNAVTVAWMYLTPIFYPADRLPLIYRNLISHVNPLCFYVSQFRAAVYYGRLPRPEEVLLGWLWALAMLALGLLSFRRHQDNFIFYL